jgi:hypothetical protein
MMNSGKIDKFEQQTRRGGGEPIIITLTVFELLKLFKNCDDKEG